MISFFEGFLMFENKALNLSEVLGFHAAVHGEHDRGFKPELGISVRGTDVNVRGFAALIAVKVKPEGSDSEHGRHVWRLAQTLEDGSLGFGGSVLEVRVRWGRARQAGQGRNSSLGE
jgi:hypothetical protein